MTYDRLVCANCAAPVAEGRCPVCRANRERLTPQGLSPAMVLTLVIALLGTLALLAAVRTV
ncbi:hypothetical protein HHL19_00110 [Streptomyces sp. R302]|uniref:hypothetical protein n=1 Tax=unclassified Streptomyces TaxID=2593676 RepID=UPI00145F924F|nr:MULTISPECIES: hypothetical protein [unclassified Streptomyces]NML48779.1 hypothetical protein [Streptomyces sp. R301]NML77106.1 hypothetical protein [Streptomyces sp. R302]